MESSLGYCLRLKQHTRLISKIDMAEFKGIEQLR
jgi:hypothetical protein